MRIARIEVENFKNFRHLNLKIGRHAVIVGENKIGKSNLLFARKLILDPAQSDSERCLREENFWDALPRPLTAGDRSVGSGTSCGRSCRSICSRPSGTP